MTEMEEVEVEELEVEEWKNGRSGPRWMRVEERPFRAALD